ncbi:DinB family protein [Nakamurella sp.]|uniref:DinB family protein n=1 Tax=Nakamurella sp. TaxID=1869182 RepID=UPI003B3AD795
MSAPVPQPNWGALLAAQLSWHWEAQARPRLTGLTDDEYFFEPVPGAWSVRPAGARAPTTLVGTGPMRVDFEVDPADPAPVTTIAWRLSHLVVGVFGDRNARYFGGPPMDYLSYAYPPDAAGALADLDDGYARWLAGITALGPAELAANCREPGFESESMAALILHIHREAIHHLGEIALLRDLWAHGLRSVPTG